MKLFPQRTLVIAAIATAFVGVSATAMASNTDLHAQHLAQRTHLAPEVVQLAQATQAAQAEPASEAKPQKSHRAHRMDRTERIERMQARHAERQARLKAELKLSTEQEPAWNAFVARMQGDKGQATQRERINWSELTTPQRLDKMQARMAERDAAMNQRFDAIKSFYASLDPEQQKVFDSQRMGSYQRTGMKGRHSMGGHGHMHHQGHHGKKPHHRGSDATTPVTPQS